MSPKEEKAAVVPPSESHEEPAAQEEAPVKPEKAVQEPKQEVSQYDR